MIVMTRPMVLRTVEEMEHRADSAQEMRDYKSVASFRFLAVRIREWLIG